jgi:hypothetical protein
VVVKTEDLGGKSLTKQFKVYTDDPGQPRTDLIITGNVAGYVEVSPERVTLVGQAGDPLVREVRITPVKGYPFNIKEARALTGQHIRVGLKPMGKKPDESGYLLTVTSIRKEPGSFGDYIEIKTDLKEKPIFGIPVSVRLLPIKNP